MDIIEGDCVERMRELDEASVDAIVCDPPYSLSFMGKDWDKDLNHGPWAAEAYRVLKPGGHLLAFGGTRTYHRLVCAIEDAGFEIRDSLIWLYGSGFPKSLNLNGDWEGWGTALKPGHEPIVMARKPLTGTVAQNVTQHGTGALNIDGCRIEGVSEMPGNKGRTQTGNGVTHGAMELDRSESPFDPTQGRWPANVLLSPEAAEELDEQSGELSTAKPFFQRKVDGESMFWRRPMEGSVNAYGDSGGASRFFLTVQPDTLCVLCGLPCAEPVGNPSPPNTASSATAPGDVRDSQPLANGDSEGENAMSASGAEPSSPSTSATPTAEEADVSAPPDAAEPLAEWIVQIASSAVPLCKSCATSIAQSVALWLTDPIQVSEVGAGSTLERLRRTLSRSLALIAAGSRATGTTPTTHDLRASFGSAFHAIENTTAESYSERDPARFRYQSKSGRGERNAGLDGFEEGEARTYGDRGPGEYPGHDSPSGQAATIAKNVHPTVKPIDLMRWLVRLVTPPGGTVLDPFAGSGTTGIAAVLEGFDFIGIEREAEYVAIAEARIAWWSQHAGRDTEDVLVEAGYSERIQATHREAGQLDLLGAGPVGEAES